MATARAKPVEAMSLLEIAQRYSAPGLLVRARLESLAPGFLMHSADAMQMAVDAAQAERDKGKRSKFIPSSEQEAEWGLYRLPDGSLYLPARSILRAFIEAGKAFKAPKSRASLKTAVAAGVTVPQAVGLGFPLLDTKGKSIKTYKIDKQRVVIQRAAIIRSRPLVPEWTTECEFLLDPEAVPPTVFAEIIGYTGARIGVGENRPEKGGQNGRFSVTSLEVEV